MTATLADLNADAVLSEGIRSLGLSLSREAREKLGDYVTLLSKWNRTYNLTATARGFQEASSQNVEVNLAQARSVDVTLAVEGVAEGCRRAGMT